MSKGHNQDEVCNESSKEARKAMVMERDQVTISMQRSWSRRTASEPNANKMLTPRVCVARGKKFPWRLKHFALQLLSDAFLNKILAPNPPTGGTKSTEMSRRTISHPTYKLVAPRLQR